MISVIIPVTNEEKLVGSALDRIRSHSKNEPCEIIVVDGNSVDATKKIASAKADYVLSCKRSRGLQMHTGALKASGDRLLFLHIDTILPGNWQSIVHQTFVANGSRPVAAAFKLAFENQSPIYSFITFLARLRTKWTGIPQGDQALIVDREAYFTAGGYPDVPLMEEYVFVPKLKNLGQVKLLPQTITTSSRKYEKKKPLFNSLKNTFYIIMFYLGVSPNRIALWYYKN